MNWIIDWKCVFSSQSTISFLFVPLLQRPSSTIRYVNSPHVEHSQFALDNVIQSSSRRPLRSHAYKRNPRGRCCNSSYITVLTHAWKVWTMRTTRNQTNETGITSIEKGIARSQTMCKQTHLFNVLVNSETSLEGSIV